MDDLISRQAAIYALAEDMPQPYTPDGSHPADDGIFMAQEIYADCIQTLKNLPTAQPEIIRCRECKFLRFTGTVWKCQNRLVMMLCEPNDYCSRAERKEKGRPYDPIWDMYLDEFEDDKDVSTSAERKEE